MKLIVFLFFFDFPKTNFRPLRNKHDLKTNQAPFMTKELQEAIMLRSKLRNRLNKLKTEQANMEYKRQRNLCTYLLRKPKRDHYSRLDHSKITDNKHFWKVAKPLFCDKNMTSDRITLVEKGEILQDETVVAEKLNDLFSNAVKNVHMQINDDLLNDDSNEVDPIMKAIKKYSHHPSILKIIE